MGIKKTKKNKREFISFFTISQKLCCCLLVARLIQQSFLKSQLRWSRLLRNIKIKMSGMGLLHSFFHILQSIFGFLSKLSFFFSFFLSLPLSLFLSFSLSPFLFLSFSRYTYGGDQSKYRRIGVASQISIFTSSSRKILPYYLSSISRISHFL